jgi:hypothetical protein
MFSEHRHSSDEFDLDVAFAGYATGARLAQLRPQATKHRGAFTTSLASAAKAVAN